MKRFLRKLGLSCKVFKNKFHKSLNKDDIKAYRIILRMLYNPNAKTPLKREEGNKYYLSDSSQVLDLIIDYEKAQIINSNRIYDLNVNKKVFERAINLIKIEIENHFINLDTNIRARKESSLDIISRKISMR